MKLTARIKGAFYITRHANHHVVHIVLGMAWFYILTRFIPELSFYHFFLAIFGSLLPDLEHVFYFYTHGRRDQYSLHVRHLIHTRRWRELTIFFKHNHKFFTKLKFHCLQWVLFLILLTAASYLYDHYSAVILLGAMVTHYSFDIVDDILVLGRINPNWKKGIIKRPRFHKA